MARYAIAGTVYDQAGNMSTVDSTTSTPSTFHAQLEAVANCLAYRVVVTYTSGTNMVQKEFVKGL